eukprot:3947214-Prymnesium_polylepis.1
MRRAYVEYSSDQMSTISTRVSVDSMEDAWATPLPSLTCSSLTLLVVEARAEWQPLLAFRG